MLTGLLYVLLTLYLLMTVFFAGGTLADMPSHGYRRDSWMAVVNTLLMALLWPALVLWFGIQTTVTKTSHIWLEGWITDD